MSDSIAALCRQTTSLAVILNRATKDNLYAAIEGVSSFDEIAEPFRTWIFDLEAVPDEFLTRGALEERKQNR